MADIIVSTSSLVPPDRKFASLDGQVVNVINGDIGNANTSYIYFNLNEDGFTGFSMEFIIQATTLTIEGSNDLPSVDNASANWIDLIQYLTSASIGGPVINFTATGSFSTTAPIPWSRMRIKRVTTNATNALKIILTRMRS